ncbi:MAG: PKD domain-containing protein [Promethearchaeota archaeon]
MKLNKVKNGKFLRFSALGFILLFGMLSVIAAVNIMPGSEKSDDLVNLGNADASGGGYTMDTEAVYSWIDISTTGTPILIMSTETISFSEGGWTFAFYETEYDTIYVNTNGYMNFRSPGWTTTYLPIPSLSEMNEDLVCLLCGTLMSSGNIYYEFLSAPNRLVIEYQDMISTTYDQYGYPSEQVIGTYEVIFYETGSIKFQYQEVNLTGMYYRTIGLDHGDLENYNLYEPPELMNLKAIEFIPGEMVPINFSPGVEVDDEFTWLVTDVNDEKMETYLGSNWEELLGLYPDPLENQKTKIKIYVAYGDPTIMSINYSTWDWINRDESFSSTPEGIYGFSYSTDPEGQTLDPLFPFILPTPTALYLYRARLESPYSFSLVPYTNQISLNYMVSSNDPYILIQFQGVYNTHGILENIYFSIYNISTQISQPEVIFNLIRFHEGPKPSYVSISEGDVYEYGVFYNPSMPTDPYNPTFQYDRMKLGVEFISGEDPIYERVLVIFNVSYRYPNGTWEEFPLYPLNINTYIYKDYSNIDTYNFQPIFMSNNVDWDELVDALIGNYPPYPPVYEIEIVALENGFAIEQESYYPYAGNMRVEYMFTPEGIINISNQYINDTLMATVRLNDFDFYFLGVEIGDEYEWIIGNVNEVLMDDYLGENWEVFFGIPENPSELDKMKIRIESIEVDSTQNTATYAQWDWINMESAFNPTADGQDSLTYLDDPLGYTEVHNLTNMIPLFLPTPPQTYLNESNLDPGFYTLMYSSVYDEETTQLSFSKIVEMYNILTGTAIYDQNGVLISFLIRVMIIDPYTYIYETEIIFSMWRNTEGDKPSYVGINEGEIYEYGVFTNPAVNYPVSNPFSDIERMMFEIDYIGGEDPGIQGALVLMNMSTMDENGIWSEADGTHLSPFGTNGYIVENPAEQFHLFTTFSYFVRTDANWDEIAIALQEYYDNTLGQFPGYEYITDVTALSNGIEVYIEQPDGSIIESFTTYTETGALNIATSKINGTEYLSFRLNDFDYEFPGEDTEPPVVIVEYIGGYTDGDPGYISVTATDNVGLSEDPTGEYPVDPTVIDTPRVFSYTATDTSGLTTTESIEITLTDDDTEAPIINIVYTGDYTLANPGELIVTVSDDSGLSIDPSGTYSVPAIAGTHEWEFIATDDDDDGWVGDSLSTTIEYNVIIENLIPTANFTVDSRFVQTNEEVSFTFTGKEGDAPASFLWDFGDGETSTEENPTHVYSSMGLYTVTLTVTDANGDVDIMIMEKHIWVLYAFPATPGLIIMMILGFVGVSIILGKIIKRKTS